MLPGLPQHSIRYWLAGLLVVGVFGRRGVLAHLQWLCPCRLDCPPLAAAPFCLADAHYAVHLPSCSGAPNLMMGYPDWMPLMLPSSLGCCCFVLLTHKHVCNLKLSLNQSSRRKAMQNTYSRHEPSLQST